MCLHGRLQTIIENAAHLIDIGVIGSNEKRRTFEELRMLANSTERFHVIGGAIVHHAEYIRHMTGQRT